MDPRIREHAEIVVDHSTGVGPGDNVVISAPSVAEDLAVALHETVGDRGATPVHLANDGRAQRAYLRSIDTEELSTPTHAEALYEESDVLIRVRAEANATEQSDVPPEKQAAHSKARQPVQEVALSKRWCLTQFPSQANAQLAGMSTEGYENFVWDAINKDWAAQREHQSRMVDVLDPASEVRIKSGEVTDVTMSVDGMKTLNDYAEKNLPGGEVFTAPVVDSVVMDAAPDGSVGGDLGAARGLFLTTNAAGPGVVGVLAQFYSYTVAFWVLAGTIVLAGLLLTRQYLRA